jgi:DNA-3-methyladenine glycosylase II
VPLQTQIRPVGPFSLTAASRFGRRFTPSPTAGDDAQMRLAFPCEDAGWQTLGVHLTQPDRDVVARVTTSADDVDAAVVPAAGEQCRRILSLDIDARGFLDVGRREEVAGVLQARYSGLRPVLFCSPYEAAAWAIIGQRIRITQAAAIKARLCDELGERVTVGGVAMAAFRAGAGNAAMAAFPAPARLAATAGVAGLTSRKVEQLRAIGHAALEGRLHPARLRSGAHEQRLADLQLLPGIGPFSAELILVRGAGAPDHLPAHERRLQEAMFRACALCAHASLDDLRDVAARWRPFRSWVCVLLRTWLEDGAGTRRSQRPDAAPPEQISAG